MARLGSYRAGNIAEDLGIALLRGIAAVSQVPIPEDHGIDAVATLHRVTKLRIQARLNGKTKPKEIELLVPEDGFFVQLKSSGRKKVTYNGDKLRWFRQMRLPMFIGSVNVTESSIRLYPLHRLSEVFWQRGDPAKIHCRLRPAPRSRHYLQNTGVGKREKTIYLGEPILEWSASDLGNSQFLAQTAYPLFKKYIQLETSNLELRDFGWFQHIQWKTNEVVAATSGTANASSSRDTQALLSHIAPRLHALIQDCIVKKDWKGANTIISLAEWAEGGGMELPDMTASKLKQLLQTNRRAGKGTT